MDTDGIVVSSEWRKLAAAYFHTHNRSIGLFLHNWISVMNRCSSRWYFRQFSADNY